MVHPLQTTQAFSPVIVASAAAAYLDDEPRRLAALKRYEILDTPPEADFDRITALAAGLFDVPVSVIALVDRTRVWFKSHHGLEATEIGRELGAGATALPSVELRIQAGAKTDIRSLTGPRVEGEGGLRFCIAAPLRTHEGYNLGMLCVMDRDPILFDEQQIRGLKTLAAIVMDHLEGRLAIRHAVAPSGSIANEPGYPAMNSLQFVAGLLNLQKRAVRIPEVADQLVMVPDRASAIGHAKRNYFADDTTDRIPTLAYLRRLCRELSGILAAGIEVDGVEANLPPQQILAIGLVAYELVVNARKCGARSINIAFTPSGAGAYELCVDDGDLPDGITLDRDGGNDLRLKVLTALVGQLDGRLRAHSNPAARGTRLLLNFPGG